MTLLERAARAMHDTTQRERRVRDPEHPSEPPIVQQSPFISWEMLPAEARAQYFDQVRAVLEAIREPSEGMLKAAEDVDFIGPGENDAAEEWKAMIDAALSEG